MKNALGLSLALAACGDEGRVRVDPDFNDASMDQGVAAGNSCEKERMEERVGFGSFERLGLMGGNDVSVVDKLVADFREGEDLRLYYCITSLNEDVIVGVNAVVNSSDGVVDNEVAFDENGDPYVALSQRPRCEEIFHTEEGSFEAACGKAADLSGEECGIGLPSVQYTLHRDGSVRFFEGVQTCDGAPNGQAEIPFLGKVEGIYYDMNDDGANCKVTASAHVVDSENNLTAKVFDGKIVGCEGEAVPTCDELKHVMNEMSRLKGVLKDVFRETNCGDFSM